jgi:hypothetical protein
MAYPVDAAELDDQRPGAESVRDLLTRDPRLEQLHPRDHPVRPRGEPRDLPLHRPDLYVHWTYKAGRFRNSPLANWV